jgi:hypothetical protein
VAVVESLAAIAAEIVRECQGSPGGDPEGGQASKRHRVSIGAYTSLLSAPTRDPYGNGVEDRVKGAANGEGVGGKEEGGVVASGNK